MEVDAATPPPPYEERNAAFTVPVVQNVLLPVREPMDQDPVPDVAIGSEQWHSNIPTVRIWFFLLFKCIFII